MVFINNTGSGGSRPDNQVRGSIGAGDRSSPATLAPPLAAQRDTQAPSTYAITNARLGPVSSAPIERPVSSS